MSDETLAALRSIPVLELVEGCQEALTSGDDRPASIALYVLGRATQQRPREDPINKASLITLLQFFGVKTRKYGTCDAAVEATANLLHAVAAAAQGASQQYLLDDAEVVGALVEQFLPHVHAQSLLLNTRRHFLSIFKLIVLGDVAQQRVLRAIAASPSAARFLKSFLTSVDGERDPTMLLEVFQMHRTILEAFPPEALSFLLEDMFESMSCYFPVLFTPPAGCQVSRQQLKAALGQAMQSPSFHELCLPFLCGKLSSPSANSKHDSLELLNGIFGPTSQYTPELQLPHIPEVLTTLRAEALKLSAYQDRSPEAMETLRNCLRSVTLVSRTVAQAVQDKSVLLSLLEPIVGGALSTIETDAASGRTYATLLHAAGRSDVRVVTAMGSYLFPMISSLADDPPNGSAAVRRAENCFSCLGGLLSAMEELCSTTPDKAAVTAALTNESTFARAAVLHSLYKSLAHTAASQRSPYVLRVACESLATWIALAKHCAGASSAWCSAVTPTATAGHQSPWHLLVQRVFAADVESDVSAQIAASIGNATRVDTEGFVTASRDLLRPWGTHGRFLESLRHIAEASRRSDVVRSLIQSLFSDHAAAILSHADEAWGGRDKHEVEATLFGLAAWLVTLCDEATIAGHCEEWIASTLSISGGAPSFEFAALLFAGASHDVQVAALRKTLSEPAAATHVDPCSADVGVPARADTPAARRYAMMVLCGSSPSAVTDAVPPQAGADYAAHLLRSILLTTSSADRDAPLPISLRCLEAIVNKVKCTPDQYAALWDVQSTLSTSPSHSRHRLLAAGAVAKGLLSRGAAAEGNRWAELLLARVLEPTSNTDDEESSGLDDAVVAAETLGNILAAPAPVVSAALWDQRFFQKTVHALTSTAANHVLDANHRLAALCALVVHGKKGHVHVALTLILSYIKGCMSHLAAPARHAPPTLWQKIAELLRSLYESSSSRGTAGNPSHVHPCLELVLLHRELFDGLGAVLSASNQCSMSGKRAALCLLKNLAVEVELLRESAAAADGDNDEDASVAQPGAVRSDATGYAVSAEALLGAARHCEKSVLKVTQPALSHPKRLVRIDAADCRRVWDRIRK